MWKSREWVIKQGGSGWSYQDGKNVIRGVQNIIRGGDGKLESYDPNLMNKVGQWLSMVDDYAHGVSQEEINDKYNSIPDDVKDGIKSVSQWVNVKWAMSNYQLKAQAESYGVKLSESELELLQKRPWIQSQYLEVKKASSAWDTDQMEEMMATILKDIMTWQIKNKGNLKTRLHSYLRMDNGENLDYLVDDLWGDFTANMTTSEKMQRIRTKYTELFWFKDRTNKEKVKESAVWLINGVKKATVNWLHWLTEAVSDVGLYASKKVAKWTWYESPDKMPDANLWAIDENALSPDTKEAVDYLKAYGLGTWAYNILDVYYDAMEETFDAKIDKFYGDGFEIGGKKYSFNNFDAYASSLDDIKAIEQREENSNYYGVSEFIWKSIPEIYVTSKIWSALTLSPTTLSKLPWWAKWSVKLINTVGRNAVEWVAFSAMESDTWDVDSKEVALFTALGSIFDVGGGVIGGKLTKWWVKKRVGKENFDKMAEQIVNAYEKNGINLTRKQWERIVADYVLEASMPWIKGTSEVFFGSNTLDVASANIEGFVGDLQKSIVSDLSKVSTKYENKYTRNMLEGIFKQSKKDIDEAYSVFRNARIGAWETEEAVAKEWAQMKELYERGGNTYTLAEQETVKKNSRTIADTYSKNDKPLNGTLNERWRDQQISSQNLLKEYASKEWIEDLWERYLQESVLIRAKKWFEKSATTSMKDIINKYAWRTLVWGLGGYVASQTIWEWPLSNPYVATATTLLIMSMWGSPRASLLASKIASKMSTVEAYSIINGADEWTLKKMATWNAEEFKLWMEGVIYGDTAQWIIDQMEWNSVEEQAWQDKPKVRDWVMNAMVQKYWY